MKYGLLAMALAMLGSLAACKTTSSVPPMPQAEAQAWAKSYDPATKRRFIPVELWTGVPWSGKHEIVIGKADIAHDRPYTIRHFDGPKIWRHNVTGKPFKIYDFWVERKRSSGTKILYFTVRDDRQGMGRVFDSRRSYAYLTPGAKFPLGYWTQGETRTLSNTVLRNAYKEKGKRPNADLGPIDRTRTRTRLFEMTIKDIDFTYDGMKHCLRFHWRAGTRRRTTQMYEYIYCPRRSQVSKTILGHKGNLKRPVAN